MNKVKTRKSIAKRFKITKNKKVIHRACGQDHFNARTTGKKTLNKKRDKSLAKSYHATVKKAFSE